MNTLWLVRGVSDFENIGPLIFRAFKAYPEAKFFVVLDCFESDKNPILLESLKRLSKVINLEIFYLSEASNKELDGFLKVNKIDNIIFEWGNGYPTSISTHLKWFLSNKKSLFRSRLIKFGKKNRARLVCLPHAVSMHKSPSIKPIRFLRKVSNFITRSKIIEDYSDRNIFDAMFFYNKIQCSNYKKFYNLETGNLGLVSICKYDTEWMEMIHRRRQSADNQIVFSIPKLRNNIDINLLLATLKLLEEFCSRNNKTVICAFHPSVEISLLPKALLDLFNHSVFEICTQPFSQIAHRASILLDAGSSILLDALAYRLPAVYLSYLDENKIVEILDDNFYELNNICDLTSILKVNDSGSPFRIPAAFVDGDRFSAEQVIFGV